MRRREPRGGQTWRTFVENHPIALHGIPDPYPELQKPPPKTGRLIALPVLGGVQHDYRLAAKTAGLAGVVSLLALPTVGATARSTCTPITAARTSWLWASCDHQGHEQPALRRVCEPDSGTPAVGMAFPRITGRTPVGWFVGRRVGGSAIHNLTGFQSSYPSGSRRSS